MRSWPIVEEAALAGMRRALRAELRAVGADPALTFDCLVAVTEACTRVLRRPASGAAAALSWQVGRDVVTFRLEDSSEERWAMARHPARGGPPPEERVDLGLTLMRELMDEVTVQTLPHGTVVTLTKMLRSSPRDLGTPA